MIKKLRRKILLIIMLPIVSIILFMIVFYAYSYYKNTIETVTLFSDKIYGENRNEPLKTNNKKEIQQKEVNNEIEENDIDPNINGFYRIFVKEARVISSNSEDENINKYAIEVSEKNNESGIIGNYIYKVKKQKGKDVQVILVESSNEISNIKTMIIISSIGAVLAIIIVYYISDKISKIITKPVEETLDKQIQFISDASHELKTPLAVIEANADVLESKQGNSKWLTYIQTEVESMDKLVNELLLLTRIDNVDSMEEAETFNLSEKVENIVSMFESMMAEKQIYLTKNIQSQIEFKGKRQDIEHILSILIDNAIKHTDNEKNIIVEMEKEKDGIILQVKNFGEKIPEEEREKIFERFYRVDKARNREEKRYGLGLAIAKATAEKYHGKIEVDYKDGYTIFKVKLPIN